MTDARAIAGNYSDLKFIKTRSVAQVIVEIPIEQADAFLKMFGAPQPGKEVPVALARMNVAPVEREHGAPTGRVNDPPVKIKPKREFSQLSLPEQCGLRCQDAEFGRFVTENYPQRLAASGHSVPVFVRGYCRIASRSELSKDVEAAGSWELLENQYQQWLTDRRYADMKR